MTTIPLALTAIFWKRLPDTKVNCGMGGDEECRLYQHRITKIFKCVTRDRYQRWTWATYHKDWS